MFPINGRKFTNIDQNGHIGAVHVRRVLND